MIKCKFVYYEGKFQHALVFAISSVLTGRNASSLNKVNFFTNNLTFSTKQLLLRGYIFYNKILILHCLGNVLVLPLYTMNMANFREVEALAPEERLNFFTRSFVLEGNGNS